MKCISWGISLFLNLLGFKYKPEPSFYQLAELLIFLNAVPRQTRQPRAGIRHYKVNNSVLLIDSKGSVYVGI